MTFAFIFSSISTLTSTNASFILCLVSAVFHGLSFALGECTLFGYLKLFPDELVGAFASGTGFSGVFSAGFYIFLRFLDIPHPIIFLICIPFVWLYYYCFKITHKKLNSLDFIENNHQVEPPENDNIPLASQNNMAFECKNLKIVMKKVMKYCIFLATCYLFEFTILSSFSERSLKKLSRQTDQTQWIEKNV